MAEIHILVYSCLGCVISKLYLIKPQTGSSGVVVITTAQLQSSKSELRFSTGLNPAYAVSEIRDGEDLWQWSQLEIRLNAFRWSNIPQNQLMVIIVIIIIISEDLHIKNEAGAKCNNVT